MKFSYILHYMVYDPVEGAIWLTDRKCQQTSYDDTVAVRDTKTKYSIVPVGNYGSH